MMKPVLKSCLPYLFLLLFCCGCSGNGMPLDEKEFTSLLLDMHRVDGTLAVAPRSYGDMEWKNYAYYNKLFSRYGITRAEFDSCLHYYSAQTVPFAKMYDVILDSLNRQLTAADKILNGLKARDSVNYFPVTDTIRLDSVYTVRVDSITKGLYKFYTTVRFDSLAPTRTRKIVSRFISADGRDTLPVRDMVVAPDLRGRKYAWTQYVDSVYSVLEISYMVAVPEKDRQYVRETEMPQPSWKKKSGKDSRKEKKRRKEKLYDPKDFGVCCYGNILNRPYVFRRVEKAMKEELEARREALR